MTRARTRQRASVHSPRQTAPRLRRCTSSHCWSRCPRPGSPCQTGCSGSWIPAAVPTATSQPCWCTRTASATPSGLKTRSSLYVPVCVERERERERERKEARCFVLVWFGLVCGVVWCCVVLCGVVWCCYSPDSHSTLRRAATADSTLYSAATRVPSNALGSTRVSSQGSGSTRTLGSGFALVRSSHW